MKEKNNYIKWTREQSDHPHLYSRLIKYTAPDQKSPIAVFHISKCYTTNAGYIYYMSTDDHTLTHIHNTDPKEFIKLLKASDELTEFIKKDLGTRAQVFFDIDSNPKLAYKPVPR